MGWRWRIFGGRLWFFIKRWPFRLLSLLQWLTLIHSPQGRHRLMRWLSGVVLLATDLLPLALIYSTLLDLMKRKSRPLSIDELEVARKVFGSAIALHLITLDAHSRPIRKGMGTAYVSYFTINYWHTLPAHILVHELVHIWQYDRYGSVYISEALWAQRWGGGYDYGGLDALQLYSDGAGLEAFNFEQQADIIEDYFRWLTGMPLQWTLNLPGVGVVLEKYKEQISSSPP